MILDPRNIHTSISAMSGGQTRTWMIRNCRNNACGYRKHPHMRRIRLCGRNDPVAIVRRTEGIYRTRGLLRQDQGDRSDTKYASTSTWLFLNFKWGLVDNC